MATSRTGTTTWVKLRAWALTHLPLVCAHCGVVLDPTAPRCTPLAPELDHIVAHEQGGTDTRDNVQWLCHPHNARKGKRDDDEARTGRQRVTAEAIPSSIW